MTSSPPGSGTRRRSTAATSTWPPASRTTSRRWARCCSRPRRRRSSARLASEGGLRRRAAAAGTRVAALVDRCEGARTPALSGADRGRSALATRARDRHASRRGLHQPARSPTASSCRSAPWTTTCSGPTEARRHRARASWPTPSASDPSGPGCHERTLKAPPHGIREARPSDEGVEGSVGAGGDGEQVGLVVGLGQRAVGAHQAPDRDGRRAPARPRPRRPTTDQGTRAKPVGWPRGPPRGWRRRRCGRRAAGRRVGVAASAWAASRAPARRRRRRRPGPPAPFAGDPVDQRDGLVGQVAGAELEAHGHALELPVGGPTADRHLDLVVELRPGRPRPAARRPAPGPVASTVGVVADGHDHHLHRAPAGAACAGRGRRRGP